MDARIAYIVCLIMIGCYSSTLNRNRRQLELDYETTTVPYEDIGDDEIDFIGEISTVANFEDTDYMQNTEPQNDTDLTPEDLLLESIILSFMESDDSFEIPENFGTFEPDLSEPSLTSFLSQREQLNEQMQNPGHDIENVPRKSILFDDWSDPIISTESNIQKINQKKRDVSKMDEGVNDFTRRYAAKYLDDFIQNIDILKNKKESKYYNRYAENFPDEPAEKMDLLEKHKESKEITGIDIVSTSEKPIVVKNIKTNFKERHHIVKIPAGRLSEIPIENVDFIEKQIEPNEFMKMYIDSILKTPTLSTDILEDPELHAEEVPENLYKKTRGISESDLLAKHESLQEFKGVYDKTLLDRPSTAIDVSEKHKDPEKLIRIHTENISEKPHMPIDILEKPENPQDFTEAYTTKDLERPTEKMVVVEKPEDLKDFARMYTESVSERPAMPIGILENHEESEEYTRIHTKRVPEKPIEFEDILRMYQNPSEMLQRYTERLSEVPIELKDTLNKQEKPQKLTGISERFPGRSTELMDNSRLLEKPRALPRAIDFSEKQKESKQHTKEYPETIVNKPTWRIDILRQYENPQAFTGAYATKISDSPTEMIDSRIKHRNPNDFARKYTASIPQVSDELTMPTDFLEMNEELQEFIKTHAKRVPERLIDSMGILNKQEKQQDITGIYSETVPEKPTDLIDDSNTHEKPRIVTEMRAEIVPEKTPYEKLHTPISNKQNESKRIHSEPMTEKPTMLSDILQKHYIPQVFAGVYAKEVSGRPTEIVNTMVKHKKPNESQRTNIESISDEIAIPIQNLKNKEMREFTKIYDIEVPEKYPSRYPINISEKQKELTQPTSISPESLMDNPSWRIDILRKHENPHLLMGASDKEVADRPFKTTDISDRYEEPNAFRRTYAESIADQATIPMDRLGNVESREFTRVHESRIPERTTDLLSVREKARTLTEPYAEIVPDKSTYAFDGLEQQKELKANTRKYPETMSNKPETRMHEEPMRLAGVYAKEVSDGPHEFTRTYYTDSKSDKLTMPTHGSRNEEATDFARIHAIRVPEKPFESMSFPNKQEKLREFTRIYTEKFLEKHTELSDISNIHENPRQFTENHAKMIPDEGTHTSGILERQKELKEHTKIHPETMRDAPTWRIDIVRQHENPLRFTRLDTKETPNRPVSVMHKEPNEFTRTYTGSSFDERTLPTDFIRRHEESREYPRMHFIKDPEKSTELVDAFSQYEKQRAPAKFNSEIVPNERTYIIDASENQKEFKGDTKPEEPMRFREVYVKEVSDRPPEKIDFSEKRTIPLKFIRTYTDSKSDKLIMPMRDLRNDEEARDFARIHSIRVPETRSEIVDVSSAYEKPRAPTRINAEIVSDKITYPMDDSATRELKELTETYAGSPSNEARMRMAFLEKYKNSPESERLNYQEASARPTQTADVSEKYNKQKVFNKMYTEGISDNPTIPIDVLGTHEEPTKFTKMNTNRVPVKFTESIDDLSNQAKLRELAEIFARRASEKPTSRIVAVDRHEISNASTSTYTQDVSRKPSGTEDVLQSQRLPKEFRSMYVEKLPYRTETPVYHSKLPVEKTAGNTPQNKEFGTVNQENYSDDKNNREDRKDVDSSVENGPTYIGLGLRVPYIEKNNSKRQSFFRSSLRRANSTVPTTKVDTHRLSPDLLDELEPLPSLEFFDHVDEDDLSEDHDDNIQQPSVVESNPKNQSSTSSGLQNTTIMRVPSYTDIYRLPLDHFDKIEPISPLEPLDDEDWDNFSEENQSIERPSFIVRAISAVVSLFMSLRRSSSEIYDIFGRLFG